MTRSKKYPGGGSDAKAAREQRFAEVFMGNGENAQRAYMEVFGQENEKAAGVQGHRMLKKPRVINYIRQRRAELLAMVSLTPQNVYREVARCSFYDPRRLFGKDGKPKPLHELDADTAAAIAAIEIEIVEGRMTYRTRPHSKTAALEQAIRLLRLTDAPPPPPPDEGGQAVIDDRELARRIAFWLNKTAHAKQLEHKPESA